MFLASAGQNGKLRVRACVLVQGLAVWCPSETHLLYQPLPAPAHASDMGSSAADSGLSSSKATAAAVLDAAVR